MSISTNCSYSVKSSGFDFTFKFNVTSSVTITHVYVEYSGLNNSGQSIVEKNEFNPVNTTFSWTWNVSSGISINRQGTFKITATNKNGETHTSSGQWGDNKIGDTYGTYLTVWGAVSSQYTNSGYHELWGYADSNPEVTSATFKWSGKDANGKSVSGQETITSVYDKTPSLSLVTKCSIKYDITGSVTMSNGVLTKAANLKGAAYGAPSTPPSSTLAITSLTVDKSRTIGMKNGKYVIGTRLMLVAKVTSSAGTKKIRFKLSGAKNSDNEWETYGATSIDAQSTAVAAGIINVEATVTDKNGKTATKTLSITISEEDNYQLQGFYFFNKEMYNALQKDGIVTVSVKLYNIFNSNSSQVDPAGLTLELYGHNYESYSACKSLTKVTMTKIKTFIVPDQKNQPYIDIPLTDTEWKKLKSYKGIAFKIVDKNKLTVHGIQCALDIEYK